MNPIQVQHQMPQIYPSQEIARDEIIAIFEEGRIHYVLFRAPLQAGKTGTYQPLIYLMLSRNMIDHAYILCGSSETQLRNQVIQDVKDWHGEGVLNRKVHVMFRQDFKKVNMKNRRVLIVNDESHLDCKKDQQLHKFLHRHRLSMSGTTPYMLENGIYIVSVSATPFAEESVMVHGESQGKRLVRFEIPPNYYGPMNYYRDGLLRETFSVLTEEGARRFANAVQHAWRRHKYVIIRIRESSVVNRQAKRDALSQEAKDNGELPPTNAEGVLDLIQRLVRCRANAQILRFTSEYEKEGQQVAMNQEESDNHFVKYGIRIPSLDVAPTIPTVILLDGRLRCGKRIHKAHIGMAWDSAAKSNTDVILQGLLGRFCGYLGNGRGQVPEAIEDRPIIYTNQTLFRTEDTATFRLSELERYEAVQAGWPDISVDANGLPEVVPRFATNLLSVNLEKRMIRQDRDQDRKEVHQCVPLRFRLSEEAIGRLTENMTDAEIRSLCWEEFVPRLGELVVGNQELTLLQQSEILNWVQADARDARDSHLRRYQGQSNQNMYRHMVKAHEAKTGVEKDRISDGAFLTFCTVLHGFACADPLGTIYVSIYTEAVGFKQVIPLSSRVAPHNGMTHFISGVEPEVEEAGDEKEAVVVAAGRYGFTPEIEWSPAAFETQMDYFIRVASMGIGYFGQVFTTVGNKNGFHLQRAAYGDDLELLKTAIQRLEATHDVRIRCVRPLGAMTETTILLRSIRWD